MNTVVPGGAISGKVPGHPTYEYRGSGWCNLWQGALTCSFRVWDSTLLFSALLYLAVLLSYIERYWFVLSLGNSLYFPNVILSYSLCSAGLALCSLNLYSCCMLCQLTSIAQASHFSTENLPRVQHLQVRVSFRQEFAIMKSITQL